MSERICSVDDCCRTVPSSGAARGLCARHYRLWKRHGTPRPAPAPCVHCSNDLSVDGRSRYRRFCNAECGHAFAATPGTTKTCSVCKATKSYPDFQRKSATEDGHASACRTCDNARRVQRKIDAGCRRPDPAAGYKWCPGCQVEKPLDEFYLRRTGRQAGKPHSQCRECTKAWHTARARARGIGPRPAKDPFATKRSRLMRDFSLTLDDYWSLLAAQKSRCAGCGAKWDDATQWFSVDHDHRCCPGTRSCGACVRGLLCVGCNFAAGHCGDDPDVLRRLARYLEQTAQGVLFRPAG